MIKETISLDEFITKLNELIEIDSQAINNIFNHKTKCNKAMADHESVQVWSENGEYSVRLIGLLNGIFGTFSEGKRKGWGALALCVDAKDHSKILKFERSKF